MEKKPLKFNRMRHESGLIVNSSESENLKKIKAKYNELEFIYPAFDEWRELLLRCRGILDWKVELPDAPFKVYRGGSSNGFSWTLDKDNAIWFAGRFKRIDIVDNVYEMTVTRREVLWYDNSREENEVVLLPEQCADDPKQIIDRKDI